MSYQTSVYRNNTTPRNIGNRNDYVVPVSSLASTLKMYRLDQSPYSTIYRTLFLLNAVPVTLADATASGSVKLADFPEARIQLLGGAWGVQLTTTSTIASTLNSGVNVSVSLGSTATADATLSGTEVDIAAAITCVSSATINVAGAISLGSITTGNINGTSTAADLTVNLAVPTGTDIDADATVTISGGIELFWANLGDPDWTDVANLITYFANRGSP